MYCGHCAPCPKGIDVASVTKFLNLARAQGMVPETVREHYAALARKARDFVGVDAEDDTRSIHDWQPTVPVHKAFREPVYPKNPNNHQQEGPSA